MDGVKSLIEEVDCVHICTPNQTHFSLATLALNEGKDVLIEKPMTLNRDDAFRIAQIANEQDLIVQCGHIFRFSEAIRITSELIDPREIRYITFNWSHYIEPISGADVLFDLLPHPIDIMHFWTGDWPIEINGAGISVRRQDQIEFASINFLYPTNISVNILLSWLNRRKIREIDIITDDYSLLIDPVRQIISKTYSNGSNQKIPFRSNNSIREEILHFLDCIKSGKNDLNSALIGIRNVEIIQETQKKIYRYT